MGDFNGLENYLDGQPKTLIGVGRVLKWGLKYSLS